MQKPESTTAFRSALLRWYKREKRDLPFRDTGDPYKVWVSELMLQQTQVATVIPYYKRFIKKFPTIRKLAASREPQVLKAWEGLGYYRRARYLHGGAKYVVKHFSGKLPDDYDSLRKIPGIGDYTAGAILCIAFGIPCPALDGNTIRVLSRVLAFSKDISKAPVLKELRQHAAALIPPRSAADWTQALMELGARICLPKNPACPECPVSKHCLAFSKGKPERYPRKSAKVKVTKIKASCIVLEHAGKIYLRKGNAKFLGGLWEFPWWELKGRGKAADKLEVKISEELGVVADVPAQPFMRFIQIYSHRKIHFLVYRAKVRKKTIPKIPGGRWVNPKKIPQSLTLSSAPKKVLAKVLGD